MIYAYAQTLADRRNLTMERDDIEWVVGFQGRLYLRDKPDFTRQRTKDLEERAERERQKWKDRNLPNDDDDLL